MARRFDAEINFGGLCLVEFKNCRSRWTRFDAEVSPRPRSARDVTVHLVDTSKAMEGHRHAPALTYFAQDNMAIEPRTRLFPSPDGTELACHSLEGKDLEIEMPWPQNEKGQPPHHLVWLEDQLERPSGPGDPAEDVCLDWALQAADIGLVPLPEEKATCRVAVPPGRWECTGAFRNRMVSSMVPTQFELLGQADNYRTLAQEVRLVLRDLRFGPSLAIKDRKTGATERIVLTPGSTGDLKFSVTNLPVRQGFPETSNIPMYRGLAKNPGVELIPPRPKDQLATQGHKPCYLVLSME